MAGGAAAAQPEAVEPLAENAEPAGGDAEDIDDDEEDVPVAAEKPGKTCLAGHPGAVTSNQTAPMATEMRHSRRPVGCDG